MTISDLLINFIFSFAVTAGFSIFFNAPKKSLIRSNKMSTEKGNTCCARHLKQATISQKKFCGVKKQHSQML